MALRPGRAMRRIERPYTRVSARVPRKSYVAGVPTSKLHQFEMGNRGGSFDSTLNLVARQPAQIRNQAVEASRIVAQNFLEKKLGSTNYFFKILLFPHQVIREKPIAQGAGADRYSRGMAQSFGAPVTTAIQVKENQKIMMLKINKNNLEIGKQALKKVGLKISATTRIEVEQ